MVTVTSGTSTGPTVFPLTPCGSGTEDMVTLGCLATGFTPSSLTFTWNKNGAALTDFIQYPPVQKGNAYTGASQIQVRRQDWNERDTLQCAVTHAAGNAQAVVPPPKPPTPPTPPPPVKLPSELLVSASDEGEQASFSCFAKDFSPKDYEIEWLQNGEEITKKIYEIKTPASENTLANGTKLYSAASFLKVESNDLSAGVKFTCKFKGKNGAEVNSTVTYNGCDGGDKPCTELDVDVKIEGPATEDLLVHKKGYIKCEVKVNRPSVEKIYWENQDGDEMAGAVTTPPKGAKGTFTLPLEITFEEWTQGVKRSCVVEHKDWYHPLKKSYERNIGGQNQRPSVFMLPPLEQTSKDMVTLTCYVKDFYPQEVFVSWLVDDEPADSKYDFSTTDSVENNGSYSAYGQLSLSLEQWKNNGVVYSCVVYHESVANSTRAIVRSTGQRTFENTNLVNLNMNIPEACKAH